MVFHRFTKILFVFFIFDFGFWNAVAVVLYVIVPFLPPWPFRSSTTAFNIIQYLLSKVLIFEHWVVVVAALLSVENVEVLLLPLEEDDEAVETRALQSIDDVLDHARTATRAINM